MASTQPKTVEEYLAALPAERRLVVQSVRDVIRKNLDKDFAEGIQYGMIGYFVPHSVYPPGYHVDPKQPLPFAALAAQKNYFSIYLMCLYGSPEQERWFRERWAKSGKTLDMGKSCIRFRRLEDIPLEVIGESIARVSALNYVAAYEALRAPSRKRGHKTKR